MNIKTANFLMRKDNRYPDLWSQWPPILVHQIKLVQGISLPTTIGSLPF
jgi:hypothetical protein